MRMVLILGLLAGILSPVGYCKQQDWSEVSTPAHAKAVDKDIREVSLKHANEEAVLSLIHATWLESLAIHTITAPEDAVIRLLTELTGLTRLFLSATCITDRTFVAIKSHPALKTLVIDRLFDLSLTTRGMAAVAEIPALNHFRLYDKFTGQSDPTPLSAESIATLATSTSIQELDLNHVSLNDRVLRALGRMPNLCSLVTYMARNISASGLTDLCKSETLVHLDIKHSYCESEAVWASLSRAERIESLNVSSLSYTSPPEKEPATHPISLLAQMPALRSLVCGNIHLTAEAIRPFAEKKTLLSFTLDSVYFSSELLAVIAQIGSLTELNIFYPLNTKLGKKDFEQLLTGELNLQAFRAPSRAEYDGASLKLLIQAFPDLEKLNLSGCRSITPQDLKLLKSLQRLTHLYIERISLNETALLDLITFPKLKLLAVGPMKVSREFVKQLQSMPNDLEITGLAVVD